MQKKIILKNRAIAYEFRPYKKSRSVRITVRQGGGVLVTAPFKTSQKSIELFLAKSADWVLENVDRMKKAKPNILQLGGRAEYLELKDKAFRLVKEKVECLNRVYGVKIKKITIRNQRARWGSCSRNGSLNFNYKIALLPEKAAEYIIAHEICHLKEFNHSKKFWDLVALAIPDHREIRRELRKM